MVGCLLASMTACNQTPGWENLERYKKENLALGKPLPGEQRVVFMGDSITEFWKRDDPGFFAGRHWINRGISGQVTEQMLLRFQQDVLDLKPAAVVILGGINDIARNAGYVPVEKTADHIFRMAEMAGKEGVRVMLCSVLPANVIGWRQEVQSAEAVLQLNRLLTAYCSQHKLTYVDYYTKMVNDQQGLDRRYSDDGVHPSLAGYRVMEPLVETAIAANLQANH